jgi:diphthamide synthase (EF-2-diphthine--ammonia ligase)
LPIPDEYGEYEVIILDSPIAKIVDIKTAQRDAMWLGDIYYKPENKTIAYVNLY